MYVFLGDLPQRWKHAATKLEENTSLQGYFWKLRNFYITANSVLAKGVNSEVRCKGKWEQSSIREQYAPPTKHPITLFCLKPKWPQVTRCGS